MAMLQMRKIAVSSSYVLNGLWSLELSEPGRCKDDAFLIKKTDSIRLKRTFHFTCLLVIFKNNST